MAFDPSKFRRIPIAAEVSEISDVSEILPFAKAYAEEFNAATTDPLIGKDGKPRMLRITAWMTHGDVPNDNRDAFVSEDLREAVQNGLFSAPHFGMIDYNHDFSPYGVWHKAAYKTDTRNGQPGVLIEGALFAWRFPELTDRLLAEQARNGFIEVSMACIGASYDTARDSNGQPYTLIRKPVFFTTSVLDVPPADPHAQGLVTEDPNENPAEREEQLTRASENLEWSEGEVTWRFDLRALNTLAREREEKMEELQELLEAIRQAMGEASEAQMEELRELLQTAERVPGLEAELAQLNERFDLLTEAHRLLEAERNTEVTASTEAELRIANLEEQLATASAELESFRAEQAERETREAEEAARQLRETRLAQLPEVVRARLDAMEEERKEKLLARWVGQDADEWEITLASLSVSSPKPPDYVESSGREGTLSTGGVETEAEGEYAFYKFVK